MYTGHTVSCHKHKTKINLLRFWIRIHQYTAIDFQGWSKITLKIKTANFSIFRSGFR